MMAVGNQAVATPGCAALAAVGVVLRTHGLGLDIPFDRSAREHRGLAFIPFSLTSIEIMVAMRVKW